MSHPTKKNNVPAIFAILRQVFACRFLFFCDTCIVFCNKPILKAQLTRRIFSVNKTFNALSVIALVLTIVGALNWLLVGIFDFNLVTWITMGTTWLINAIYIVVGIAGIFMLIWLFSARGKMVQNDYNNKYAQRRY